MSRLRWVLGLTVVALLAVFGGSIASFIDTGSASVEQRVGTFEIEVTSSASDAVVVNSAHTHTVTLPLTRIMSSAAGDRRLPFTVKNLGEIPVSVSITAVKTCSSTFSDMLPVLDRDPVTLNQGQSKVYAGGLSWPELNINDAGNSGKITYNIKAEEVPSAPPLIAPRRLDANTFELRVDKVGSTDLLPGDKLSSYNAATVYGVPGWTDNLATADEDGVVYYKGDGLDHSCTPSPGTPPFYFDKVACPVLAPVGSLQLSIKRNGSILGNLVVGL